MTTLAQTDETTDPLLWAIARELAKLDGSRPRACLAAAQRMLKNALHGRPL